MSDDDTCQHGDFPDSLFCGDCYAINAGHLATFLPHIRPDRAHYTLDDVDRWIKRAEATS